MMRTRTVSHGSLIVALSACIGVGLAHADTLNTSIGANSDLTGLEAIQWNSTISPSPTTVTGTGVNGDGQTAVNVLDLSQNGLSTYTFHDNFAAGVGATSAGTINGNPYGFVDTYVLNLPASTASAFAFSLDICSNGCSGEMYLTARLYDYSAGGIQNLTIGGVGAPAHGGIPDPWSPSVNGTVSSTAFTSASLVAGEYVLQIAGIQVANATGGSYSASIGVTPVPLPATLPLLLAGMALVGARARRRAAASP